MRRLIDHEKVRVLHLHGQGKSASEVAELLGFSQSALCRWMQRQGITPNFKRLSHAPAVLERTKKGRLRFARSQGCGSFARWLVSRRRRKYDAQWPGCVCASEVAVCRALADGAPRDVRQVAGAVGWAAPSLAPVYALLKRMVGAGLLVRLGRRGEYTWRLVPRRGGDHHED